MSDNPVVNPFCHLDNRQLAAFRTWLDDHWTWDSDDPTSRKLKEMMEHAETMQGGARLYVSDTDHPLTIEDVVAGIIKTEKETRGDKDSSGLTNECLQLVANHIGMRLEFFLGKDIVNYNRVMQKSGFAETS